MSRWLWLALIILPLCGFAKDSPQLAGTHDNRQVTVGSKEFTEGVVLGAIATRKGQEAGVDVSHREGLGGTRILWRALTRGDIDVYAEYTGTITHELLRDLDNDADIASIRKALEKKGIGITDSLGFSDTYAIGMRKQMAQDKHIKGLSDLAKHPELKVGISNEFLDREDGWPGIVKTYDLPMQARGMEHALAYKALDSGAIDVTDLYSTDAEITYYNLRVLDDDKHYFPPYDAVYLYRLDLEKQAPDFIRALNELDGSIDEQAMSAMNKAVQIDKKTPRQVAADFLEVDQSSSGHANIWHNLWHYTWEHLALVGISLLLAILIAVPLGIFASRYRRAGQLVLALTGMLQTIPSLALFVFMIPLFGIGAEPAIAALFLYSLLPIVRNTYTGLATIEPALLESAAALGLPAGVRLRRIELILALRTILAGVKVAAVINVGTATLGALIGAGGYGQPILTGIRLDDIGLIMQGAIPAAILALLMQGVFELVERSLTPRGLRLRAHG